MSLKFRFSTKSYPLSISDGVPVVILLHGVYGSHWAWTMKGKAHETAQRLIDEGKIKPMILVMPSDGLFGDGSAYVPHKTENYEQWIVEDVIQVVKERIPQATDDSPIFITGLSMGELFRMLFLLTCPDTFGRGVKTVKSARFFKALLLTVMNLSP